MYINKWLLASLKAKAEQIENLNPKSEVYATLCSFLEGCNDDQLRLIVSTKIKWFSNLANKTLVERTA